MGILSMLLPEPRCSFSMPFYEYDDSPDAYSDLPPEHRELARKGAFAALSLSLHLRHDMVDAMREYRNNKNEGTYSIWQEKRALVKAFERCKYGSQNGTDDWWNVMGLITITTGVTGFDDEGVPERDDSLIIPEVEQLLAGNRYFQAIANEYLARHFEGKTLSFTHTNRWVSLDKIYNTDDPYKSLWN